MQVGEGYNIIMMILIMGYLVWNGVRRTRVGLVGWRSITQERSNN